MKECRISWIPLDFIPFYKIENIAFGLLSNVQGAFVEFLTNSNWLQAH